MNGSIYVKSQVDVGTEFYFSLEYDYAKKDEMLLESKSKNIIGLEKFENQQTILVVDDIQINRTLLTQVLTSYGFTVFQASSGFEAINIFNKEQLDLIFMDIKMSVMDVLETIKLIREKEEINTIPIIAVSANVFNEDKQSAIKSGANDFLAKPIDEKELLLILSKYLNLELEYLEKEENSFAVHEKLKGIDKDFFVKLNEYSLLMDFENIEKLLQNSKLDEKVKIFFKDLIDNFKYKEINDICIKNIQ